MKVIFKIAIRNLFEHKAKTLIIGIIIAVEIFFLVLGSSILDTASAGLKKAYIDNFTGHIMIYPKLDDPFSRITLLGKSGLDTGNMTIPVLQDYPKIEEYVKSLPEVALYTPQIAGLGIIGSAEKKALIGSFFGIDPVMYQKMFNNIDIIEGSYLKPGEEGIMLSEKAVEILKKVFGELKTGDKVQLNSYSGMNIKIRDAEIRGIYRFKHFSNFLFEITFIDAQGLRALTGMNLGGSDEVILETSETSLLTASEAELLSGDFLATPAELITSTGTVDPLADLKVKSTLPVLNDTWNFVLLKLKNESMLKPAIMKLNSWFIANQVNARAQDWVIASGGMAQTANQFKLILNVLIAIISIVAIIIIINTLVISVMERTAEIGMMRALGAQKGFIWKMLIIETMLISLAFGMGGIVLGLIVIGLSNLIGIPTGTGFLNTILGAGILRPEISVSGLIWPIMLVVLIGIVSQLYPAAIATKIKPIKAIHAE